MTRARRHERVIASRDVRGFFHDSVARAMSSLDVCAAEHTVHYVVDLLTLFTRSEALYPAAPHRGGIKPLALMFADAMEAATREERAAALKRLGDVALFVGGFFAQSLSRSLVDVDYYVAMGGNAYGTLSDAVGRTTRGRVLADVYRELAGKFQSFVDVLAEISDSARPDTSRDVLRLYELWLRTGSRRARRRLGELGVHPAPGGTSFSRH